MTAVLRAAPAGESRFLAHLPCPDYHPDIPGTRNGAAKLKQLMWHSKYTEQRIFQSSKQSHAPRRNIWTVSAVGYSRGTPWLPSEVTEPSWV